jgi:hypothetical protein
MGFVARVAVKETQKGGSAFAPKKKNKKNLPGSMSLSERRKHEVNYALKSIILDRVSPTFIQELKNEIDILKGMVCDVM